MEVGDPAWVKRLCQEFQAATNSPLHWLASDQAAALLDPAWSAPVNPGVGTPPGYLAIERADGKIARGRIKAEQPVVAALAATVAELLNAFRASQRTLWQREAELAAGVPVVPRPDEKQHLAARLMAVLKGGAEAVGCTAAGLYLLDTDTTELKLRASWNLPTERLLAPARLLRGAVADLEAMAGSAVVLEDDLLHEYWKVPEDYPACVCLPVSSPSTILGTVWFYADAERPFTDLQTNQLEIVAGRLAADLEREMLLAEGAESKELRREVSRAEFMQASQSLGAAPRIDGWQMAAWQQQGEVLGGAFHDWWMPEDDRAIVTVGKALDGGLPAAIVGASVRTALRAHGDRAESPLDLLTLANHTLWTTSAGDQFASVLAAELQENSSTIHLAAAGQFRILIVDRDGRCQWRKFDSLPLALSVPAKFRADQWQLMPGSTLVAWTGFATDSVAGECGFLEAGVCEEMVAAHRNDSVTRLAELLHDLTTNKDLDAEKLDHAMLIVRRLGD
jgi:phosphoserine phosphatase RsbU/P